MRADDAALLEEIASLLRLEPGHPALARIENTLTTGYARALALEAERWRLERRIGELAARGQTVELAAAARRMSAAEGELSHLRGLLGSLRERARDLRPPPTRP